MLLPVSFLFALAGAGFGGAAALGSGTGVDATPGAYLALAGAVGLCVVLGLLAAGRIPARAWALSVFVAVLLAILTGLAAWFLMQFVVAGAMVLSAAALLADGAVFRRRVVR